MGWAYSVDLRERVVAVFDLGGRTDEQVAELFQVGEATVHRWKRLKRETGSVVPKPPRGGGMPPRVRPEHHELVRTMVKEEPGSLTYALYGNTSSNRPQVEIVTGAGVKANASRSKPIPSPTPGRSWPRCSVAPRPPRIA